MNKLLLIPLALLTLTGCPKEPVAIEDRETTELCTEAKIVYSEAVNNRQLCVKAGPPCLEDTELVLQILTIEDRAQRIMQQVCHSNDE
jgi:hypothetical protein